MFCFADGKLNKPHVIRKTANGGPTLMFSSFTRDFLEKNDDLIIIVIFFLPHG